MQVHAHRQCRVDSYLGDAAPVGQVTLTVPVHADDDIALAVIWMARLLDAPESEAPRRRVERLQRESRPGRRVDAVVQVPDLDLALSGVRYRRLDHAEV